MQAQVFVYWVFNNGFGSTNHSIGQVVSILCVIINNHRTAQMSHSLRGWFLDLFLSSEMVISCLKHQTADLKPHLCHFMLAVWRGEGKWIKVKWKNELLSVICGVSAWLAHFNNWKFSFKRWWLPKSISVNGCVPLKHITVIKKTTLVFVLCGSI